MVKVKIMPESPDTNLKQIADETKTIVEHHKGRHFSFIEEPIAFGLKAVIGTFMIIETFNQDPLLDKIRLIPHVNSAEIIDFRRAFG